MLRNWFAGYKHNIYNIIIILLLYTLSAAIAYTGVVLYTHAQTLWTRRPWCPRRNGPSNLAREYERSSAKRIPHVCVTTTTVTLYHIFTPADTHTWYYRIPSGDPKRSVMQLIGRVPQRPMCHGLHHYWTAFGPRPTDQDTRRKPCAIIIILFTSVWSIARGQRRVWSGNSIVVL